MRRFDKKKQIAKVNLLIEQRYLESKGLINELEVVDMSDEDIQSASQEVMNALNQHGAEGFVDKFSSIASDPKVQAVLKAGLKDGDESDDKVTMSKGSSSVANLVPTQNEIGFEESLKNILTDKYGSLSSFIDGNADIGENPVVIYNNKYIIDGHHRWSQVFVANPKASIKTVNIEGSLKPDDMLKVVHLSVAAGAGKLPLSNAKGENLLTADLESVYQYAARNLTTDTIKIWVEKKLGKKFDLGNTGAYKKGIAKYIAGNVKKLQKNGHYDVASGRGSMPQTDAVEPTNNVLGRLNKGEVNFNEPANVVNVNK